VEVAYEHISVSADSEIVALAGPRGLQFARTANGEVVETIAEQDTAGVRGMRWLPAPLVLSDGTSLARVLVVHTADGRVRMWRAPEI